jgi:hypothetical protein
MRGTFFVKNSSNRRNFASKTMEKQKLLKTQLEVVWWLATAALVVLVLLPIWLNFDRYPFWWQNAALIVAFITFSRYLFLLRHSPFAHLFWWKITGVFLLIPIAFSLVDMTTTIFVYVNDHGLAPLMPQLSLSQQAQMDRYVQAEVGFFGVGGTIAGLLLILRLIRSIWLVRNRGRV